MHSNSVCSELITTNYSVQSRPCKVLIDSTMLLLAQYNQQTKVIVSSSFVPGLHTENVAGGRQRCKLVWFPSMVYQLSESLVQVYRDEQGPLNAALHSVCGR